ncbi:MAG: hypothetical protein CMI12_08205 [Oceanospirillum sp.]|nr:hypothetical protein [Oceanospirillum sp.]
MSTLTDQAMMQALSQLDLNKVVSDSAGPSECALNDRALSGRWLLVAHDAGAANVMAAWLPYLPDDMHVCAQGPAARILAEHFDPALVFDDLSEACSVGIDVMLTGTGWQSDLEHDARALAQQNHIYSIAVIDHWSNYAARFVRHEKTVMADKVVVLDLAALEIARKALPVGDYELVIWPNLYLQHQVDEIKARMDHSEPSGKLLYLLEPMRKSWSGEQEAEFDALAFFFTKLEETGFAADKTIIFRPHPSESDNKYLSCLAADIPSSSAWQLDRQTDMAQQIAEADAVFGCCSFALVIAAMAGIPVYCTIPEGVDNFRLPHQEIRPLSVLDQ